MAIESKKRARHVGFCPTCGNTAPQQVIADHLYSTTWYAEDGGSHRNGPEMWAVFCVCETCNAPLFYDGIDPRELGTSWSPLVYPQLADFGHEVPATVQKIYVQAIRCQ